jgi:putative transcriptional regulator
MSKYKIEPGTLLIAEPYLHDAFFHRAVVMVCEHNDLTGSMGFCLNKPLDLTINDLVEDFPDFAAAVYCGGPVRKRALFFLHNVGDLLPNSRNICQGIWWGMDFDALRLLVEQDLVSPNNIRFFVGYSGWSEHQLHEEMEQGTWVLTEMHPNYMFKESAESLWQRALEHKGKNFAIIADIPDGMSLN